MGDASDGIRGVPGVGAKTAAKLLNEYGTIAGILENVDNIKGKVGQSLKDNVEGIALDHQLASIVIDLDLSLSYDDLKLCEPDVEALRNLYTELEFRNQLQSLDHPNNPNSSAYKQTTQSIGKTEQPVESEITDQATSSSVDDRLDHCRGRPMCLPRATTSGCPYTGLFMPQRFNWVHIGSTISRIQTKDYPNPCADSKGQY